MTGHPTRPARRPVRPRLRPCRQCESFRRRRCRPAACELKPRRCKTRTQPVHRQTRMCVPCPLAIIPTHVRSKIVNKVIRPAHSSPTINRLRIWLIALPAASRDTNRLNGRFSVPAISNPYRSNPYRSKPYRSNPYRSKQPRSRSLTRHQYACVLRQPISQQSARSNQLDNRSPCVLISPPQPARHPNRVTTTSLWGGARVLAVRLLSFRAPTCPGRVAEWTTRRLPTALKNWLTCWN